MNKEFKKGKWTNVSDYGFLDVYNVGPELIVPPKSNNYCFPANNIVAGCIEGTYEITIDTTPSQDSLQDIINHIIKELDKANG